MVLMIGLSFGCTSVPHTSIHTKKERITGTRVTNNCSVPVLVGYVAAYRNKEDYKKSELKKLKKEGYDIIPDFKTQYRFYKVQDNKIVCTLVDFYPYYKIDDILLGKYKSSQKIGNKEFRYYERFYRYVDNRDDIIYEYSE